MVDISKKDIFVVVANLQALSIGLNLICDPKLTLVGILLFYYINSSLFKFYNKQSTIDKDLLYSSVHDKFTFVTPPKASPAFCEPEPASTYLDVINAPPVDQDVPLYSSVHDTLVFVNPPNTSPRF
jgi:hypothetical protein